MENEKTVRVCISIPKSLLDDLDDHIKSTGYNNRTKGLINLIREFLIF